MKQVESIHPASNMAQRYAGEAFYAQDKLCDDCGGRVGNNCSCKKLLTGYDMVIITDCLHGSLRVSGTSNLWKFTTEQRKEVLQKLYDIMDSTPSSAQKQI